MFIVLNVLDTPEYHSFLFSGTGGSIQGEGGGGPGGQAGGFPQYSKGRGGSEWPVPVLELIPRKLNAIQVKPDWILLFGNMFDKHRPN